MKPVFVAMEGLHGVGKSSVAAEVAGRLGATLIPTIPDGFTEIRKIINGTACINSRYALFLSAILLAADGIRQQLKNNTSVVVESYIYRTIAFHQGMGSTLRVEIPPDLLLPTSTYWLQCSEEERGQRRQIRGRKEGYWDMLAEQHAAGICNEYARFSLVPINTSTLSISQVAGVIVEDVLMRSGR